MSGEGFNDNAKSVFPGMERKPEDLALLAQWFVGCGCGACTGTRVAASEMPSSMPFIVCPDCGSKRCPKAAHHDQPCAKTAAEDSP